MNYRKVKNVDIEVSEIGIGLGWCFQPNTELMIDSIEFGLNKDAT